MPIFTGNLMSFTEHLRHWKTNQERLDGFADQIAKFKKSLTRLLSQQAVQHLGKHTDTLVQIESRLVENRAFYATIRDAHEETVEISISKQLKQGGGAQVVSSNYLAAGLFGFLWLFGPGQPPLEATRW